MSIAWRKPPLGMSSAWPQHADESKWGVQQPPPPKPPEESGRSLESRPRSPSNCRTSPGNSIVRERSPKGSDVQHQRDVAIVKSGHGSFYDEDGYVVTPPRAALSANLKGQVVLSQWRDMTRGQVLSICQRQPSLAMSDPKSFLYPVRLIKAHFPDLLCNWARNLPHHSDRTDRRQSTPPVGADKRAVEACGVLIDSTRHVTSLEAMTDNIS
ncbi:hypothetical protein DPEC_G00103010 [Dallia pectoralis]|uniref:Uncharacterized protein n=1 Tax=Dallia pectoralis TaxID=75939 RepID=A0ACC2GX84_DALPE|nr:hypothetical protein DPEC_G00103010 [Dallia pectoralis]